jgi:hypothetical protein
VGSIAQVQGCSPIRVLRAWLAKAKQANTKLERLMLDEIQY